MPYTLVTFVALLLAASSSVTIASPIPIPPALAQLEELNNPLMPPMPSIPKPVVPAMPTIPQVSKADAALPTPIASNVLSKSPLQGSQNEPKVPQKLEGASLLATLPILQTIGKDAHIDMANLPTLG